MRKNKKRKKEKKVVTSKEQCSETKEQKITKATDKNNEH